MAYKIKRKRDKDLWLKHLRSGEHQQTKGALGRVGEEGIEKNCCLGLICKVTRTVERRPTATGCVWYGVHLCNLPTSMQERLGIDLVGTPNKSVRFLGRLYETLAGLNDAGAPFEFIADVIEEQF